MPGLRSLFLCTGANAASCYNTTAGNTTCCGCATDASQPAGQGLAGGGYRREVLRQQHDLGEAGAAWLAYLKKACPTAYTYPFDDATGTFQCPSAAGPLNSQDYTITLRR